MQIYFLPSTVDYELFNYIGSIFFAVFLVQQHLNKTVTYFTINFFIQLLTIEEVQAVVMDKKHLCEWKDCNLRNTGLGSTQTAFWRRFIKTETTKCNYFMQMKDPG